MTSESDTKDSDILQSVTSDKVDDSGDATNGTEVIEHKEDDNNEGSCHSLDDNLVEKNAPKQSFDPDRRKNGKVDDLGTSNLIPPILQEALGINEQGKCIRHPTCPVLLFTKDSGIAMSGIYKIVSCRVCYAEEKSIGIRQGKSFSAVVAQLRNLATHPPEFFGQSTGDDGRSGTAVSCSSSSGILQQNSEVFDLHNSLGSLGEIPVSPTISDPSGSINTTLHSTTTNMATGVRASGLGSSYSNNFLSTSNSTTAVMESIMKRLAQVHNWSIRQKDKEIMSLQLHINSLEQQLAVEQAATEEQKTIVKALRKTIQQDLKIIKTMATTQKQREELDDAVGLAATASTIVSNATSTGAESNAPTLASMHNNENLVSNNATACNGNGGGSSIEPSSEPTSPEKNDIQGSSPLGLGPIRYFSPSKAFSPENAPPPPLAETTCPDGARTVPKSHNLLKPQPQNQEQSSDSATPRRKEHPNSVRSIAQQVRRLTRMQSTRSIEEPIIEVHDDTDGGDEETVDARSVDMPAMDIQFVPSNLKTPDHNTYDLDDEDDDDDDGTGKNKMFSTGTYWNEGDMKSLKSAKIFQSFRGGVLDIPKSPPKARHDLDEKGNGIPPRRKKLTLNTNAVDTLKFPARGVISRTSSSDEVTPLFALQHIDLGDSQHMQSHPQTPLVKTGGPLDTPTSASQSSSTANQSCNLVQSKDISLDTLALKLSQLPLSAQTNDSSNTPDSLQFDTKVKQHPNMPLMSPLEVGSASDTEQQQKQKNTINSDPLLLSVPQPQLTVESTTERTSKVGKDKKIVFSVTNALTNDKFGDEGIYTGDILVTEGLPHGKGKMKYESGRVYDGEWVCGQWHGHGKLLNPNGDTYTGEFFFDSRHGHGIYKWDNGDVYDGSFVSDKRHGKGKFSFHNGNVYTGEFCDGMFEGYGKYEFEGGHYIGDWKAGRYDGNGELVYSNGGKYTGEFRNSVAHGFGIEVSPDGRVRRGIWTLGKPSEKFDR